MKPTAAAVALLSECRTKILMLERDGLWGIPGGKGEFGETHEATARREFEEETGLRLIGPLTPIARFDYIQFDVIRFVGLHASGTLCSSTEGVPSWRSIHLLGTKARFPKPDAELARLLIDGGWCKA